MKRKMSDMCYNKMKYIYKTPAVANASESMYGLFFIRDFLLVVLYRYA